MGNKYPLAKPYIGEEEERAVLDVLRSGVLSIGPKIEEFEQKFAKFIGVRYACAVSSGTAGLHLALIAAGIKAGDEVITTPFSFVASANCILYVGARPVFADIDPDTFNINPKEIEKHITRKTKAILVVHIFGQPADMDPILKIARKYKLKIIEDACESLGALYKREGKEKGKMVGGFGESAVFAFYPNKQMTTGEGGMLVTNSARINRLCCSLRNQGRLANRKWLQHDRLGYNYRMDEISAALGLAQLKKIGFLLSKRRVIAGWYNEFLSRREDIIQTPTVIRKNTHSYFLYTVIIKKGNRDAVIKKMEKSGISAKPYFPSIHLFRFYKKQFGWKRGSFQISESVSRRTLSLPLYIGLSKADVAHISETLIEALR